LSFVVTLGDKGKSLTMAVHRFERPYPLLRFFLRYIVPGIACLLVISATLTVLGARHLAEGLYLEQATRRAQVIDRAMTEAAPEPWRRLKNGESPGAIYGEPDGRRLLDELTREVRELDLAQLKIYSSTGVIQYSSDTSRIGTVDRSPAFIAAAERGTGSVVHRVDPSGSALYELYVLLPVPGSLPVIFELYEPVDHLNELLWRAGAAAVVVPSLILLALTLAMARLVVLAQRDLNGRAALAIENVRLLDEIQDKNQQLAEASQHKSQFLANMSHELRTPLNAILGYTELIMDGVYGTIPEKMNVILKRVESNGRHLLGLINAVLDLSKIEAGQLVLDFADYSLKDVVQTVCTAVEPLATDKKLALKAHVPADLPLGHGDERRLTQVLLNLVGNAIKFSDFGEVVIKAVADGGSFNVSVRDTGPGISVADQAKLFQEFQQADNSITRKKGGTGLGLAISKRIIEMHGGKVWIESQVGQGSTFAFTLPIRSEPSVSRA
jgi:signal transduction histidine kinase